MNLLFSRPAPARIRSATRTTLLFGFLALACAAAPVGRDRAAEAGRRWLDLGPRPMNHPAGRFGRMDAYPDASGDTGFYVVNLEPAGYVVIAADDELEPVIAFSSEDHFVAEPGNPLFDLLQRDVERRLRPFRGGSAAAGAAPPAHGRKHHQWNRLAAPPAVTTAAPAPTDSVTVAAASSSTVSDVRVDPMVQSRWNQSTVWNGSAYVAVFNYYTPPNAAGSASNYVAGCVATAWAQIMRFHQWPTAAVGTTSFTISVDGVSQQRALRGGDGAGGAYDWGNMVLVPGRTVTAAQAQAIGALLHDAGVANNMAYASGGSGAYIHTSSIKNVFHFASGVASASGNLTDVLLALRTNLDAGLPVAVSIFTTPATSGHEVVCDGYGYNLGTLYHHLNLGWGGAYDAWYNLPEVSAGGYAFDTVSDCTYNIDPTVSGEIVSGRCTDASGNPVSGIVVTATGSSTRTATTNSRGIFAFKGLASSTTWTLSRTGGTSVYGPTQTTVTTGASSDRRPVGNRAVDVFQAPSVSITAQPTSQTVAPGGNTSFAVTAAGTPTPTLQWQLSTNGGSTWANLTDTAPYSGSATATLTLTGVTSGLSGGQYRCIATNSTGTATSNAATLTVIAPPANAVVTITVQ